MSHKRPHNTTSGEDFSPGRDKILVALLAGQTVAAAAKAADVDRNKVYRWLRDRHRPSFRIAHDRDEREFRRVTHARRPVLEVMGADCIDVVLTKGEGKAASPC